MFCLPSNEQLLAVSDAHAVPAQTNKFCVLITSCCCICMWLLPCEVTSNCVLLYCAGCSNTYCGNCVCWSMLLLQVHVPPALPTDEQLSLVHTLFQCSLTTWSCLLLMTACCCRCMCRLPCQLMSSCHLCTAQSTWLPSQVSLWTTRECAGR